MKKETKIKRIENIGYKIIYCLSGNIIAKKNNKVFIAPAINKLYESIFK